MAVTSAPPSAVTSAPPFEWFVDPTRPIPFRPPGISGSSVLATQAPRRRPTGGSNRTEPNGSVPFRTYAPTLTRITITISLPLQRFWLPFFGTSYRFMISLLPFNDFRLVPFPHDSCLFGSLFSVHLLPIYDIVAPSTIRAFSIVAPSTIRAFSAPFSLDRTARPTRLPPSSAAGPFNVRCPGPRLNPREGAPRGLLTSVPGTPFVARGGGRILRAGVFFGPFPLTARLNPREGAPRGLLTSMPGTGRRPPADRTGEHARRPPRGTYGLLTTARPLGNPPGGREPRVRDPRPTADDLLPSGAGSVSLASLAPRRRGGTDG